MLKRNKFTILPMAFSFTRLILEDTERKIYYRGSDYSDGKKVTLEKILNNACLAIVHGKHNYQVSLGFTRVGSPRYICNCPYYNENNKTVCKHIIATSIVWDRHRNVPDPDEKTIENLCIPDPTITRKDINEAYNDPLHADLEVLRRASDEMGWTRPHARLPLIPKICENLMKDTKDIKRGISELRVWSRKYSFDPYFCAGEMVAGFCELIRWIKNQLKSELFNNSFLIMQWLIDYNRELIMETIDDSDGLHIFSEAHLLDLLMVFVENNRNLTLKQKAEVKRLRELITDY